MLLQGLICFFHGSIQVFFALTPCLPGSHSYIIVAFLGFCGAGWFPLDANSCPSFRQGHLNTLFPSVVSDSPGIGPKNLSSLVKVYRIVHTSIDF